MTVFDAPRMARPLTAIAAGELTGVEGFIATALNPEFVIITDCELFGRMPKDQFEGESQLPLPGLVHEFTCAGAVVTINASADAMMQSARDLSLLQRDNRISMPQKLQCPAPRR